MTALDAIRRALGRGRAADAPGDAAADLSPKERQDALKLIARARRHLRLLERQLECGLLIRRERESEAQRLDALAGRLSLEQAASHLREAVARASYHDHPVPHIVVSSLLPDAVLVEARGSIPAEVFFDAVHDGYEAVAVPFALAPVVSMATWAFVATLARGPLLEALLEVFHDSLGHPPASAPAPRRRRDFTVLHARLVRWQAGARRDVDRHPLPSLVAIVNVGESAHRFELRQEPGDAIEVVLPPGSAMAYLTAAGREATVGGIGAEPAGGRTYEVVIGPNRAAQRALAGSAR